ncbi:hypothetical protein SM0020_08983 [Sinorhizobium meliloti CCNWSX0020]|jgi:hypothetical protein|uniref:Uncharacterized protein n=1 Tax=Sinorhizobium meliloti CCNWSX0020 TaxID=1107881 RepID=H0FX79_RHIML|nr:hypothetical protein SM0020_08983 [Sinorhizobium meliloti CCNWSX0020]
MRKSNAAAPEGAAAFLDAHGFNEAVVRAGFAFMLQATRPKR